MTTLAAIICTLIGFAVGWIARGWSRLPTTTSEIIEGDKDRRQKNGRQPRDGG
jgi:2-keto-3-deoxy-galactonokinase